MRVAVFGAGGIGGYLGVKLAQAGDDVVLIARGAHLAAIQAYGLFVESPAGNCHLMPSLATDRPEEVDVVDVVILGVKAWDVRTAALAATADCVHNAGMTQQSIPDSSAELLAVERAWTAAHLAGDFAAIAHIMADDYVRIQPDGSVAGKAEVLAAYDPNHRHWEHAEADEYDVRVYGETAVVVGRWRARGVNNGQPFDYAARFLSVYVRCDGRWQMVAEQSTAICAPL